MIRNKAVGSLALAIITAACVHICAAEKTAAELYGQGVHAYFASDFDSAIASLTDAIKKNDADPRAYYFRGLALASWHGLEAGMADFAAGADREVNRRDDRLYDVNGALQRVQGSLRLALEKQRSAARAAAAVQKQKQDRVKYEQLKRREYIVLFKPDQPIAKVDLQLPAVDLHGQDPFATGVAFSGGKEVEAATPLVVEPAEPATPPGAEETRDPFGGSTKPAPSNAAPNPFGDLPPAADPFGEMTPEQPPKAEKEPPANPFGNANPFGEGVGDVDPDNPVFDKNVRPELPPGMNVGGTILDLLGKTLSGEAGQSEDRDPFSDDAAPTPPQKQPPAGDAGAPGQAKPDPNRNPFD